MFRLSFSVFIFVIISLFCIQLSEGHLTTCFQCHSRGELGNCKDPFIYNATQAENESGVTTVSCASGWCGKVIESGGVFRADDYEVVVQRMCVERGPSDSEGRCAFTVYNDKQVYMCFCQEDLCNSAKTLTVLPKVPEALFLFTFVGFLVNFIRL